MATQLFLLDSVADTHLGTDNTNVLGTAVGWASKALGTARGSGVIASDNVATVTGATLGVTITKTSAVEWISPPVAADVTISGTITANIWASETNMSANVAINVIVDIIRANATATRNSNTIVQIVKSTNAVEVAVTTRAANNFTSGMTSGGYTGQTLNRGDRLRVRVFGDDVGTMAATYTFNASWGGTGAAADGDSYVTFTENITFESAPGVVLDVGNTGSGGGMGTTTSTQQIASPFVASGDLIEVRPWLAKLGAPTDNVVIEVQTDSSGSPSGSVVGTVATVAGTGLATGASVPFTYSTSIVLSVGVTYWIVLRRSGALSDTDRYTVGNSGSFGATKRYDGSAWVSHQATSIRITCQPQVLYLTDTASAVSTASNDQEAWTTRDSGVVNVQRTGSTGWAAPQQLQLGGVNVDWFTRPLTAFTLSGMAVANLRAQTAADVSDNNSVRCEIARVDGDGTNPTVWGSWCIAPTGTDGGKVTTTETARTAYVSGDDLAFTDGQRIRIRLYKEDASNAACTNNLLTVYYGGTSGGASGDTYITLPQTLTEFSSAPGPSQSYRFLRANRFLTSR